MWMRIRQRSRVVRQLFAVVGLIAITNVSATAADVVPHNQEQAPGPPLSPEAARARMTVPDGFRVQLVASEPNIVNPVAMTFDARGRIWLTESLEYPRRSPGPGRDRIKILEDSDGDGRADTFKIFAEGLNIPSGIALGRGGAFVANAPDLLFLRDTNGDDVADETEVLLTGFGRHDVHELPSALTWGPDGWLYGLNGVFNPAHIHHQGEEFEFTCALWRYHPVTKRFELFSEGTSNPWGLDYDRHGSFFVSACVVDHLWHFVQTGYYHRQAGAYPPHVWKIESIVDHRHYKAAYCGLCIYDADAYPPEYRGNALMGNIHEGAINRDVLERNGATYVAKARSNFLDANDVWFMPVVQKVGPDGSVYVADWYDRYHCYQDANRDPEGIDRLKGRIWRIVYGDTKWPEAFDIGAFSNARLVETLGHANVWWRRQAQRMLAERRDTSVVPALQRLALGDQSATPAARHALWTLVSMGPLDAAFHAKLLDHDDPIVRAWGVRAAGEMGHVSSTIAKRLVRSASDESPDVRLQAVIAARRVKDVDPVATLMAVMSYGQEDELLPHILWRNLQPLAGEHAAALCDWLVDEPLDRRPMARALASRMMDYLLTSEARDVAAVASLLRRCLSDGSVDSALRAMALDMLARAVADDELSHDEQTLVRESVQEALHDQLRDAASDRSTAAAILTRWKDEKGTVAARAILADAAAPWSHRREVLAALAVADPASALPAAEAILVSGASPSQQRDIIAALGAARGPAVAELLIRAWPALADSERPLAVETMARRREWARVLLEAVGREVVPRAALNTNQARQIAALDDSEVLELLTQHWGTLREGRNEDRERIVRAMRNVVRRGEGDPIAGQQVFIKVCAQCHRLYDYGAEVGPDLTGVGRSDLDQLLSNILDPNLVIGAGYKSLMILTLDGEVLTGLPVEDSPERVVLKLNGGATLTIPRDDIDQMKYGDLSLMPEDLEKGMSEQDFRDLIRLLMTEESPAPWPDVEPVVTPLSAP